MILVRKRVNVSRLESNIKLKAALTAARAASMPKDNIERALNGKNLSRRRGRGMT